MEKKVCTKCGLPEGQVTFDTQRRQCRECRKAYLRENRSQVAPCLDCGSSFQPCQMDFDHVRGRKLATVSQLTGSPWATLLAEVQKCDLVCGNCHRTRTQSRHPGRAEAASDRTRKAAA